MQPSGRTYHVEFQPPKVAGKDDVTGEDLIKRPDDNEATLVKRLAAYHQQTGPVLQYYARQKKLTTLDAAQKPVEVYSVIRGLFNKLRPDLAQ